MERICAPGANGVYRKSSIGSFYAKGVTRNEGAPDERYDDRRPLTEIGRCKTQDAEPGVDEEVLPAIVLDQPFAMAPSVELDDEPGRRIVEIGSPDETAIRITQIDLDLRGSQPRRKEQPPKPCLHRRLGGFRERGEETRSHPA